MDDNLQFVKSHIIDHWNYDQFNQKLPLSWESWLCMGKWEFVDKVHIIFDPVMLGSVHIDVLTNMLLNDHHINGYNIGESMLSIAVITNNYDKVQWLLDTIGVKMRNLDHLKGLFHVEMTIPIFRCLMVTHRHIIDNSFMEKVLDFFVSYAKHHNIDIEHSRKLIKFALFVNGYYPNIDWDDILNYEHYKLRATDDILSHVLWREMVWQGLGMVYFNDDGCYYQSF